MFHIGFLCGVFACAVAADPNKTTVSVYYGTMDYNSRKFLLNQLYPVIESSLAEHINLELIPYGKTVEDVESSKFWCPNGESECYLTKIESCVVHYFPDQRGFNLIKCLTQHLNTSSTINDVKEWTSYCEIENKMNSILTSCAEDPENAPRMMRNLADMTRSALESSKTLPIVILNHKFNETEDALAKENLKGLICPLHQIDPRNCIVRRGKSPSIEPGPTDSENSTIKILTNPNAGSIKTCYFSVIMILLVILAIR